MAEKSTGKALSEVFRTVTGLNKKDGTVEVATEPEGGFGGKEEGAKKAPSGDAKKAAKK